MRQDEGYNERQYARILHLIERYEGGQAGIASLIDDVYALIRALEGVSDEWRRMLIAKWAVLEETYAIALADRKTEFDKSDKDDIALALQGLKKIIEERGPGAYSRTN
ncbi:MAG: hypothetical protein ACHRXM_35150 [Isosphaerales bacterium]